MMSSNRVGHSNGGKSMLNFTFEITGLPVEFELKIWYGKYSALLPSKSEKRGRQNYDHSSTFKYSNFVLLNLIYSAGNNLLDLEEHVSF